MQVDFRLPPVRFGRVVEFAGVIAAPVFSDEIPAIDDARGGGIFAARQIRLASVRVGTERSPTR